MQEIFLEALDPTLHVQALSLHDLDARLQACVQQAQQAWPHLSVQTSDFLKCLAGLYQQNAESATIDAWLLRLHCPDLYLAFACTLQNAQAIEVLEHQYAGMLRQIARRFANQAHPEEDLLQTLREKLFVDTPQRDARIRHYAGQGPLHSWLRVTATRTFLDCVRSGAQQKREHGTDDRLLMNAPDLQTDVELDFLKREYRAQFKESFEEAMGSLSSSERNLLRQNLIAGLSIDQIGAIYHIHRATAARRIARARETLLERTRLGLLTRLKLSNEDFDSLMEMIRSRLDLSLHRLLKNSQEDETSEG
ncbi:MAG: sigma-70 family RNA polymerase sigma factor [Myxococcales bacterium]|nr:sigma-70 family RNA polymerase sigma factor [Myxococcales bacterium]